MDANLCRMSYVAESIFATNSITRQSGTLTLTGSPAAGETVTIGAKTYTWRPNVPQLLAANDVCIGGTPHLSLKNLRDAIHANAETAGVAFNSATVAHTLVYADLDPENDLKLHIKKLIPGAPAGLVAATGTLTSDNVQVTAGDSVTIDAKTYTFRAIPAVEGEVDIGADADGSLTNLRRAIEHTGTPGTDYVCAFAHPTVTCSAVVAHVVTLTARTAGTAGNAIGISEVSTHLAVNDDFLSGGTDATIATTETLGFGSFGAVTLTGGAGTAPAFQELRFTGESLVPTKQTVRSEEIRSDRSIRELVQVGKSTAGSLNVEMLIGPHDDFIIAALMAGAWTEDDGSETVSVDGASKMYLRDAGNWSDIVAGARYIKFDGFTDPASNGIKRIRSVETNQLVVWDDVGAEELGVAGVDWAVKYARNGVTFESFKLLKEYLDNTPAAAMLLNGQCINQLDLNLDSRSIAKAVFGFIGADSQSSGGTFAASITEPGDKPILNTSSNVGEIAYTGEGADRAAIDAPVMKINLSVKNNLGERPHIGSLITAVPRKGTCEITGQITTYFKNRQAIDDFLDHVNRAIEFALTDSDGSIMNVFLPRCSFPTAQNLIGGINTDIVVPLDLQAIIGPDDYMIQIDSLAAA